jgi:hypothetical protein
LSLQLFEMSTLIRTHALFKTPAPLVNYSVNVLLHAVALSSMLLRFVNVVSTLLVDTIRRGHHCENLIDSKPDEVDIVVRVKIQQHFGTLRSNGPV